MTVRSETRAGTCRIVLDRPENGNAYDAAMLDALFDAIGHADADPAVRVILLTGAGRHLSVGPEPSYLASVIAADIDEADAEVDRSLRLLSRLDVCSKITVVRVEGAAVGLAAGLVAAADIAVVSDEAEFAVPDVRHGLVPVAVAPWLVRAMGVREARRLLLTGDRMKAADARAASLVQEVVPRLALDAAVDQTVISLMKGDGATLEVTKGLALEADGPIGTATLDRMRRLFHEGRRADVASVRRAADAAF